jgi:uncharacterized protein involved in response to NO
MRVDPSMTVAEIVRRNPAAGPVLARFGLDTCCGGIHPLEHACRAHKIDVATVLHALEAVPDTQACGAATVAAEPAAAKAPGPGRPITGDMIVRDILAAHPGTGAVLARHGLMGCGGREGPVEPIGWFAKVHGVPLPLLLDELNEAAASATPVDTVPPTQAELSRENLYRRFLKTAILFTLTGGTALGAWALVLMALRGSLGGVGRGILQVHGHWQLFGWVGLFVVGVAYHILPRLTGVPLPSYRAATWSYAALTSGAILRFGQAIDPSFARSTLLLGGAALEIAGCSLFAWTVARILFAQPGRLAPYQRYLALGTAWLVVASLLNLAHVFDLLLSGRFEVSAWLNVPYLTVFLVGFVTFWILGVSLRTLPVFMGLGSRPRLASALATPLALAVLVLATSEALFLRSGGAAARIGFGLGGILTALGLVAFTYALGILSPPADAPEPGVDRGYEKFVRLAYAWLLLSGLFLVVFSIVTLRGAALDHAYVGAYRHALTVGFITTIMVGMACRIVPVFRGVPLHSAFLRDLTFWLLAVGNVIRVLFQSLSAAAGPAWLRVAGISGLLELVALLLFAWNFWRTMDAETADDRAAAEAPVAIAPETRVGTLLEAYPALLPVFVGNGFAPLANPLMRKTVARGVSVAQACRMHGVDLEDFLDRLRSAARVGRA